MENRPLICDPVLSSKNQRGVPACGENGLDILEDRRKDIVIDIRRDNGNTVTPRFPDPLPDAGTGPLPFLNQTEFYQVVQRSPYGLTAYLIGRDKFHFSGQLV